MGCNSLESAQMNCNQFRSRSRGSRSSQFLNSRFWRLIFKLIQGYHPDREFSIYLATLIAQNPVSLRTLREFKISLDVASEQFNSSDPALPHTQRLSAREISLGSILDPLSRKWEKVCQLSKRAVPVIANKLQQAGEQAYRRTSWSHTEWYMSGVERRKVCMY